MIIIDLGNALTKVHDTKTNLSFEVPTVIGHTTQPRALLNVDAKRLFIGQEALKNRAFITIQRPIQFNRVVDSEALVVFLRHILYFELKQLPDHLVILVHASFTGHAALQQTLKDLKIKRVQFALPGMLPLLRNSSPVAISLDVSDSGCETFAVYNGTILQESLLTTDFAGRLLSERLLQSSGAVCNSESDFLHLQEHFYGLKNDYKIQNSAVQNLAEEFLVQQIIKTILAVPLASRARAAKNLVISGGITKIEGFEAIIIKKMQEAKAPYTLNFVKGDGELKKVEQMFEKGTWIELQE
ncbi:Actin [Hexamita inflata]|uniref:Actin n=1 Tax=Hexamita inflata TaxID=28002 RepID=A0AA86PB71_9EUKA|nr:Actin [Hexamita inflata]